MDTTTHYGLIKPDAANDVDAEFYQLQSTLDLLDTILHALAMETGGKAPVLHAHEIEDVVGLAAALASKMNANATFKLDSLTDVDGADAAPVGYVLVKTNAGWIAVSPATAMGNHNHTIAQINGLDAALIAKLDDTQLDIDGTLAANADDRIPSQKAVRFYVGTVADTKLNASAVDTAVGLGVSDAKVPSQKAVKSYVDTVAGTKLNASALDINTALGADDAKVPSQKAVKTYVDGLLSAIRNGVSASFDTLKELADNFANYVPIITNRIKVTANIGSNPGFEFWDTFNKRRAGIYLGEADGKLGLYHYDAAGTTLWNWLEFPTTSPGGELVFNGDKVVTAGNIANIYGATIVPGGVGAIHMLAHGTTGTALGYGTNYAGSALRNVSLVGDGVGVVAGVATALSGTWKCLGTASGTGVAGKYSIALFLRIA